MKQLFIAEDNSRATVPYSEGMEAYDAFIEEYDMEPLRIIDITRGYDNAFIVWEREL